MPVVSTRVGNLLIRSCRSFQWKSLTLLLKKERCKWFACDSNESLAKNKRFAWKNGIFLYDFDSFSPIYTQERIAPVALCSFAIFKKWLERFDPIALYKRATVSDLLRLLMALSLIFCGRIALSLTKTSKSLKKPMSEFPTLVSKELDTV